MSQPLPPPLNCSFWEVITMDLGRKELLKASPCHQMISPVHSDLQSTAQSPVHSLISSAQFDLQSTAWSPEHNLISRAQLDPSAQLDLQSTAQSPVPNLIVSTQLDLQCTARSPVHSLSTAPCVTCIASYHVIDFHKNLNHESERRRDNRPSFGKSLNFSVNKCLLSFDFGLGINTSRRALENC